MDNYQSRKGRCKKCGKTPIQSKRMCRNCYMKDYKKRKREEVKNESNNYVDMSNGVRNIFTKKNELEHIDYDFSLSDYDDELLADYPELKKFLFNKP